MSEKYREAGVDLEAGYESVRLIKSHVARTKVLGAVDSIGAFGGMFDLSLLKMNDHICYAFVYRIIRTRLCGSYVSRITCNLFQISRIILLTHAGGIVMSFRKSSSGTVLRCLWIILFFSPSRHSSVRALMAAEIICMVSLQKSKILTSEV